MGEEKTDGLQSEVGEDRTARILLEFPSSTDLRISFKAQNISAEQILWASRWLEREGLKLMTVADTKRLQEEQRNKIAIARRGGNGANPSLNQMLGSKK